MKRFSILFILAITIFSLSARQPQPGYRGFLEWSNNVRSTSSNIGDFTEFYTGVSTSHGYQIKEWIYAGAGVIFEYYKNGPSYIFAPFFDVRSDLKFGIFTPFVDARIGYNFTSDTQRLYLNPEIGGVYFSPKIGYRFNWGRKIGLNLGVGLTLIGYRNRYLWDSQGQVRVGTDCYSYFSFNVGFDF